MEAKVSNNQVKPHKFSRRSFSVEEDAIIIKCVALFGDKAWKEISKYLPDRTPRQISERYCTYLKPGISFEPWTKAEDDLLRQKVNELGTKWKLISTYFPNRSQNNIKNRWNSYVRKTVGTHMLNPIPPIQNKSSSMISICSSPAEDPHILQGIVPLAEPDILQDTIDFNHVFDNSPFENDLFIY
ncbi:Myb-like DNA-binding domain containing protein [Histomonas meleagridis]|uniref:Myb-like DNA-binding domain containing protein n=1 Tax=Histomonas meleagridis TaxID=135588 RepID=UPI0035599E66|nr:Myb-like DNA-binding domain containing protein [Histomonas meleagridis]KAH0807006.1 Myb-like DNA-binding domain containing protein [Histomonas meleagridis]